MQKKDYFQANTNLLTSKILNGTEKIIIMYLISLSKNTKENICKTQIGVSNLSKKMNCTDKTIINVMKRLEKSEIIDIERTFFEDGGNAPNIYYIYNYSELWECENAEEFIEKKKKIKNEIGDLNG